MLRTTVRLRNARQQYRSFGSGCKGISAWRNFGVPSRYSVRSEAHRPSRNRAQGGELPPPLFWRKSGYIQGCRRAVCRATVRRILHAPRPSQVSASPRLQYLFLNGGCGHGSFSGARCAVFRPSSPCRAARRASACRVGVGHDGPCEALMGRADVHGRLSIVRCGLCAPLRCDGGGQWGWEAGHQLRSMCRRV